MYFVTSLHLTPAHHARQRIYQQHCILTDIFCHLNALNLQIQGNEKNMEDMVKKVEWVGMLVEMNTVCSGVHVLQQ